jgi:hypothetical protein
MKIIIIVLIALYSLFVFVVGDTAQKGMLLSVLVLTGLIALFYKYSTLARTIMSRYEELKKAVFTADNITHFIDDLDTHKDAFKDRKMDPGLEVNHTIGVLKRAKLLAGISKDAKEEEVIKADDSAQTLQSPQSKTTLHSNQL